VGHLGAGGIAGAGVAVLLIGRPRLAGPFGVGVLVWGSALAAVSLFSVPWVAAVLLAVAGLGRVMMDVVGRTLLQRVSPDALLSRVCGGRPEWRLRGMGPRAGGGHRGQLAAAAADRRRGRCPPARAGGSARVPFFLPLNGNDDEISELFWATIEATEEAIINSLVAAQTMVGRDGMTFHRIPHDRLVEVMRRYGRLPG
jgi:Peptidase family S58